MKTTNLVHASHFTDENPRWREVKRLAQGHTSLMMGRATLAGTDLHLCPEPCGSSQAEQWTASLDFCREEHRGGQSMQLETQGLKEM